MFQILPKADALSVWDHYFQTAVLAVGVQGGNVKNTVNVASDLVDAMIAKRAEKVKQVESLPPDNG